MSFYIALVYVLAFIGLFGISYYSLSLFSHYRKCDKPEKASDKSVSIIIPAHNEKDCIISTIKSALALDYPKEKLEILVVNDGSKDNTFELAKTMESDKHPKVRVFSKKAGGKSSALNYGIKRAKGEIIVSMDADTFARPDALQRMIVLFDDEKVMSVTPSMGVYKPKTIWQRIQHIEYYVSVFIRKCFSTVNAIHITPGAFSAYRKSFFDRYGGYDEHDITEDLEIALRIQSHDYVIANASKASVFTVAPAKFKELMSQRRRWYMGLVRGLWKYRVLFSPKKGALGVIVLPIAVSTVILALVLSVYLITKALWEVREDLINMQAINFQFKDAFELNFYILQNFFYGILSHKVVLITIFFVLLTSFYLYFSRRQMKYTDKTRWNFVLFIMIYSFLFTFWWTISIFSVIFNKGVIWKHDEDSSTKASAKKRN